MSRLFQLLMPAIAAVLVGLFVLVFLELFEVRGGLFVLGLYMLGVAAALSAVGATSINTTARPATAVKAKKRRRMLDIARQPDKLARAYVQMYTIPFVPIALLTFGTGILVSVMLHGIADSTFALPVSKVRSAVPQMIMATWLVLMSLGLAALGRRPAALGCAVGIAAAAFMGEVTLSSAFDHMGIWGLGLVILIVLILMVGAIFRWRSAHRVQPA